MRRMIPLVPFAALLVLVTAPGYAQCGPGHAGHGGSHGSGRGHSGHEEQSPKVTATNVICPVMGKAVKPGRDMEVVIGGRTYLVCCPGCGPEMAEHKVKYLDKDGKPLNTPKKEEARKDEAKPEPTPSNPHQH